MGCLSFAVCVMRCMLMFAVSCSPFVVDERWLLFGVCVFSFVVVCCLLLVFVEV